MLYFRVKKSAGKPTGQSDPYCYAGQWLSGAEFNFSPAELFCRQINRSSHPPINLS
jgi:hypothetical protein